MGFERAYSARRLGVAARGAVAPAAAFSLLLVGCGGGHPLRPDGAGGGDTGVIYAQADSRPADADAGAGDTGPARDVADGIAERADATDAPAEMRADGPVTPGCPVDCTHLPHVRAGTPVACVNGACAVPQGSAVCDDGFGHCSSNPNDGCEADFSSPKSCGSCAYVCPTYFPSCVVTGSSRACGPACAPPTPDVCFYGCTDFKTDPSNCGGCGQFCSLPNAFTSCEQGQCKLARCSDASWADCTPDPGCETQLGTADNCSACSDRGCALANTLLACQSADACARAVCAVGFGNCDAASPDCETSFAAGGGCLPGYLGTTPFAAQPLGSGVVAIGTDGSYFLAGNFSGTVDFDPTAGKDIQSTATVDDTDGFITKLGADGSYAWTRTFTGRGGILLRGVAAAADGAVVAVGEYSDSVDLDPSGGVDLRQTITPDQTDMLVVKLAADGSLLWGRTFPGTDSGAAGNATGVAVDPADAVYVAAGYQGSVDFDPGPGMVVRTVDVGTAIVKLDAGGDFSWVQSPDNGSCFETLSYLAVATDGTVWAAGAADASPGCPLGSPSDPGQGATRGLIAAWSAAGTARGVWLLGDGQTATYASPIVAGDAGSVYVAGTATGMVDFDPGPGLAPRWVGPPSGALSSFLVKLGPGATFLWETSFPENAVGALAGTADGGVLASGYASLGTVTKLGPDGKPGWTFAIGGTSTVPNSVAARGATFAVAGTSHGSEDFDPGTGIDVVFGDIIFLSRFTF